MNTFCHNCGESLTVGDIFCESCGTKIIVEKIENKKYDKIEQKSTKHSNLEQKAWYRGVKVFYIFIIIVSSLIIFEVFRVDIPSKEINEETSSINCYSGKSYGLSKNNINIYGDSTGLSYAEDMDARILCKYDTLNFTKYQFENIDKNYTLDLKYNKVDYSSWFGYLILSYFILFVVAYLIKITFLYVVVGEKPKINF